MELSNTEYEKEGGEKSLMKSKKTLFFLIVKQIFDYITNYYRELDKRAFLLCTLFTGLLIYLNFHYRIDDWIDQKNSVPASFYYRYIIFFVAFFIPYVILGLISNKKYFLDLKFILLLIVSPAIFSWKIGMDTDIDFPVSADWNFYLNEVTYWPLRLIMLMAILFIVWIFFYRSESFFGFTVSGFKWKPYILMLVIMVPLIAIASTQPDFQAMYPKLNDVNDVLQNKEYGWFYHFLHELSYGSDFISVELFFRGFLILAFVKIVGKDAIIPMACFYCTIHFGKPLGECISSYFGGMLLGIVVYNTRSIIGGLIVHVGIAWFMEIGGYIGNAFK